MRKATPTRSSANTQPSFQSAALFLVATTLNLVIRLYGIICVSIFVLSEFPWERKTYAAIMFLDPIIDDWIFVVTVALVFFIALRKHNGLWTTMQPWMDGQGPCTCRNLRRQGGWSRILHPCRG